MLGLRRRKRQEGWAVDVEHVEPDGRDDSVRQRLADSDKLWVAAIFAVVLVVVVFFMLDKRGVQRKANPPDGPAPAASLSYNDAAHRDFAEHFVSKKGRESTVTSARFLNAKKFRIIVRGDVGADEISYLASMAANRISYEFKTRAAVQVYRSSAAEHRDILVATAVWKDDRFGFVVQFDSRNSTVE